MDAGTAVAGESDSWAEVLRLARRGGADRALVAALLERVVAESGARGGVLSLDEEQPSGRELSVGAIPEDSGTPTVVEVPGGELRLYGAGDGAAAAPAPVAVLIATLHARRLAARLKRQDFEVAYRGVELEALYDVGLAIARARDADELTQEILMRAVSLLDARRGALYLLRGGELLCEGTFGGDARPRLPADAPGIAELFQSAVPEGLELLPGAEHLLTVPIEIEGRRQGLLVVGDKERRQGVGPFAGSDRRTLSLFANQAAIALENARLHRQALEKERLERETELAADIQRRLLPDSVPRVEGLEIIGWNRPARMVGGDYYALGERAEGCLALVVADVTGKGMPAALLVSNLHSALHLLLEQESLGPTLVERLNRHIHELSTANKFITLFVAEADGSDGMVRYVNAGHDFPIVIRRDGQVERLASAGMPIGLFAGAGYQTETVRLGPGDLLCCYSDGITECASRADEEFGADRLIDLLRERRAEPLGAILTAVDRAVVEFAAGAPQGDDQTVVLMRRDD